MEESPLKPAQGTNTLKLVGENSNLIWHQTKEPGAFSLQFMEKYRADDRQTQVLDLVHVLAKDLDPYLQQAKV